MAQQDAYVNTHEPKIIMTLEGVDGTLARTNTRAKQEA